MSDLAPSLRPRFTFRHGQVGDSAAVYLQTERALFGRSSECHHRFLIKGVSRVHCELIQRDGKLFVHDLWSKNGTFVNRQRVGRKPVRLLPYDTVLFGHVALRYVPFASVEETILDGLSPFFEAEALARRLGREPGVFGPQEAAFGPKKNGDGTVWPAEPTALPQRVQPRSRLLGALSIVQVPTPPRAWLPGALSIVRDAGGLSVVDETGKLSPTSLGLSVERSDDW